MIFSRERVVSNGNGELGPLIHVVSTLALIDSICRMQ